MIEAAKILTALAVLLALASMHPRARGAMKISWACVVAVALLLAGTGLARAADPNEAAYWRTQAQLLDPASYRFIVHDAVTIPEGQTWRAVNLWRARDSHGSPVIYLRDPSRPITLPAGTKLDVPDGFAYVSMEVPESANPRALYYRRMARLRSLPIQVLTVRPTELGKVKRTPFPTDFTAGMVVGASSMDVAWVALAGAKGEGVNLADEVSDDHQIRNAQGMLLPFNRADFPGIMSRASEGPNGVATVLYVKLPADW